MLALLWVACLFGVSQAAPCIDGLSAYAGPGKNQFYSCSSGADEAVLKTCEGDMEFDRASGGCAELEVLVKRSSTELNREIMGETVAIGTLFDARKNQMYNGFSVWNAKTIEAEAFVDEQVSQDSKTYIEDDFDTRSSEFGIGASLTLDFLGGMIKISGSAEYMRDDKASNEIARVSMKSRIKKRAHLINAKTPPDNTDLCSGITGSSGPTHVVVGISYGQRAYFNFDKVVQKGQNYESVKGSLEAEILLIPSFTIRGSVAIHVNGSLVENLENTKVRFYGDAILDSVPTTYNQAIVTFRKTVENGDGLEDTPIAYSLAPISKVCDETTAIVKDITNDLVMRASDALIDLKWVLQEVNGLLDSEPALRYQAIREQLVVFKAGLTAYTNVFKSSLLDILPKLRADQMSETALVELVKAYDGKPFRKGKAEIFLNYRKKEILTIESIISEALSSRDVTLSDIQSASDNVCMFRHKRAAEFNLHILPASDIANQFIQSTSDWKENEAWFNKPPIVKSVGHHRKQFMTYVQNNLAQDKDHCFLFELSKLVADTYYEMFLYEQGVRINKPFTPPDKPNPPPTCTGFYHNGIEISTKQSPNNLVTGHKVTIRRPSDDGTKFIETVQFLPNAGKITVMKLEPHMVYTFNTRFAVHGDHGVGPVTDDITCQTRSTSPPAILTVSDSTANSLTVTWATPEVFAPAVAGKLSYKVDLSGAGSSQSKVTTSHSHTFANLKPGTMYNIKAVVQVNDPHVQLDSQPISIQFTTAPAKPQKPTPVAVPQALTDNRAKFSVNVGAVRVPSGVEKELLVVKYSKIGDTSSMNIFLDRLQSAGNTHYVELASLASGTTYEVQVKIMVKVGNRLIGSDFSELTTFKTTDIGSDVDKLRGKLDSFQSSSSTTLGQIEAAARTLDADIQRAETNFNNKKSAREQSVEAAGPGARFETMAQQSYAYAKERCIYSSVKNYFSRSEILQTTTAYSVQQCLSKCKDLHGCASVTFDSGKNICQLLPKRRGKFMWPTQSNMESADLFCSMSQTTSVDARKRCILENKQLTGGDLLTGSNVNSMDECVALCRITNSCQGVSYESTRRICHLKSKRTGDGVATRAGWKSFSMYCPGAASRSVELCKEPGILYSGGTVGTLQKNSLRECVEACAYKHGCESVSYAGRSCRLNSKRRGDSQPRSSSYTSVNMYCLGLMH